MGLSVDTRIDIPQEVGALIICRKCNETIVETELEFTRMMNEQVVVRVRTGPPGFADFEEFHTACVGGKIVGSGQDGDLVWHTHANGDRCTGNAAIDGIQCGSFQDQ